MLLLLLLSGNQNEILSLVGLEAIKDILQHDLTYPVPAILLRNIQARLPSDNCIRCYKPWAQNRDKLYGNFGNLRCLLETRMFSHPRILTTTSKRFTNF